VIVSSVVPDANFALSKFAEKSFGCTAGFIGKRYSDSGFGNQAGSSRRDRSRPFGQYDCSQNLFTVRLPLWSILERRRRSMSWMAVGLSVAA
jgi:hypothetical protein